MLLGLVSAASVLCFLSGCSHSTDVMANGWKADDYLAPLEPGGGQIQSYVFFSGGKKEGDIRDPSLDRIGFEEICAALRPQLARQGYVATPFLEEARLALALHWGMTQIDLDQVEYDVQLDPEDPTSIETHTIDQQTTQSVIRNARLLGLRELAELPRYHNLRSRMLEALEEERYYVLVVAYDIDRIIDRSLGYPLVWIARFSVFQRGTNFTDALPAIARVSGNYFGRNAATNFDQTHLGLGEVIFGELEETGPDEPDAPAPDAPDPPAQTPNQSGSGSPRP